MYYCIRVNTPSILLLNVKLLQCPFELFRTVTILQCSFICELSLSVSVCKKCKLSSTILNCDLFYSLHRFTIHYFESFYSVRTNIVLSLTMKLCTVYNSTIPYFESLYSAHICESFYSVHMYIIMSITV